MNKKFYEAPAFEEVEVLIQSNLLAGSTLGTDEGDDVNTSDSSSTHGGGW